MAGDNDLDGSRFKRNLEGKIFICYWYPIAIRDLKKRTSIKRELPVSYLTCSKCTKETCLTCQNYIPSVKVYDE